MELRKLVIQALHAAFPELEVYGERVEQGFRPPCCSVRLLSGYRQPYPGGRWLEGGSLVVRYFPSGPAEAACAEMGPRLAQALEVLPGNAARARRLEWELQDGVLQFHADYSVFTRRSRDGERMGSLTLQEGVAT